MLRLVRTIGGMLVVAALMCAGNLCINASKQNGVVPYSSVTATFLIEVLKLVLMLVAIAATGAPPPARFPMREAALYAVPSFLYMLDNNLTYVVLRFLDPATLAVLWNLKIITTAVLFRFVLKRELTELRKIAIVLLLLGVVTSQSDHIEKEATAQKAATGDGVHVSANANANADTDDDATNPRDFMVGIALVLVGVTLSSCASVFTEWAFKRKTECSFMWQNVQFYVFGILFNGLALFAELEDISTLGFFHGYSNWTVAVIVVNCVGGISMGFILKYLDNIACVYSHAIAMMLTMLFSMIFFQFTPSLEFVCGLAVLIISMYLYHHKVNTGSDSCASSPTCSSSSTSEASSPRHLQTTEAKSDVSVAVVELPHGLHLKKKRYEMLPSRGELEDGTPVSDRSDA